MNTTLEDQIAAINKIRRTLKKDGYKLAAEIFPNPNKAGEADDALNDAANTIQAVRLIGIEKVMYAGEMFDLLSSGVGSGWLSWMAQKETMHSKINELILDKIHKYQP